jgi:tetratricopeptide (TPR) repeat protein/energy-coupling factor transporter ATP-binding protein EcfA2
MEDSHSPKAVAQTSDGPAANDLFLSYNRADREAVLIVRRQLQARGVSVYFDSENLLPGLPWVPALDRALQEVRAVAVFIGKGGLGNWQMREISLSLDRQVREEKSARQFPVIPVLLPQANTKDALGFLLLNTWIDLRDGLDDMAALDALVRAVNGAADATVLPAQIVPALLPPYRALRPFREADAPLFFGREVFARQLQKKVSEHRLVAVVGPSGSGKSSVVQAGLLPLLRRERPPATTWEAVVFPPGKYPFHNMAVAFTSLWEQGEMDNANRILKAGEMGKSWAEGVPLGAAIDLILKESSGTDRLLIILDQFEEIFTLTPEADRQKFIKALLDAADSAPVTIVLTLRADFYGQSIGLDRDLSDLIQAGIINLGNMKRDELRMAVERPAKSVGLCFQEGLVERILDHIEGQPGHLPLLEFTLTELWERRQGTLLTNEQYDAIGGVEGAISKRADALINALSAERQEEVLRTLARLVRVTAAPEESADTRRRMRLSEIGESMLPVMRSFTDARLLVTNQGEQTGEETIELAHEALIHAWERLRSYLDADRDFLLWRQRLNFMMDEWKYSGFDRGALLRRVPLAEATRFADERAEQLNEAELEFIEASEQAVIRRRRWVFTSVAVAVLALLATSLWMVWRRSDSYQIQTVLARGSELATSSSTGKNDEWLAALVYYGRTDEALDIANDQIQALAVITEALMKTGHADEAKKIADRAYARASNMWADSLRESFPSSDARFEAFFAAAKAYAAVGEVDAAQRAINEALAGRELDQIDINAFSALARLSVKIGRVDEILTAVHKSGNGNFRSFALGEIAEALARGGKFKEALDSARDDKRSFVRLSDLVQITRALNKKGLTEDARQVLDAALAVSLREEEHGSSDPSDKVNLKTNAAQVMIRLGRKEDAERLLREALQIAHGIDKEKWKPRSFAYSNIVSVFLELGKLDDAMIAYREITAQPIQLISASELALKLIRAGRTQEALSVASKVREAGISNPNPVFAAIAIEIARAGRPEEALDIIRNINDSGKSIATADGFRADALVGIAKALARMRRYRSAIELIDQYPALNDQLTVYSAILREYAKEHNSALAKLLEAEEQDEEIFPWLHASD